MATATFAIGSPTALSGGAQPKHTTKPKPPPSSEPEPEAPPPTTAPPPPPPDPLIPRTIASSSSITPEMKKEGLKAMRTIMVGVAVFLGDCLTPSDSGSDTTDPVLCYVAAQAILTEMLAQYKYVHDPPDPKFMEVALGVPVPAPPPPGGYKCPKKAKKSNCAAVNAAFLKYRVALNANARALGGGAITLERFSGAVQANSVPGALLQEAAQKAYAGLIVSTMAAQQAAGTALALTLRKTHLDRRPTKSRFQANVKKLSTSKGIPRQVIERLIADRQIGSAAELDQILKDVMASVTVPHVTLSRAFSLALPTAATAALWRSMTYKDLAALIRGLAGQNAVPAATADALIEELRQIANTASADARKPLLATLVKDAGAVSGPAGSLLAAGANGLN
jgi:hypothetical protein